MTAVLFLLVLGALFVAYMAPTLAVYRRLGWVYMQRLSRCQGHSHSRCDGCLCGNCGNALWLHEFKTLHPCPKGYRGSDITKCRNARGAKCRALWCSLAWPVIIPWFVLHKFRVEHGWDVPAFFKPPPTVESRDQKIKRLEAEVETLRLENDERLTQLGVTA